MSCLGNLENGCIIITECLIAPIVNPSNAISSGPVWDSDSGNYHTTLLKSSSGNQYIDTKDSTSSPVTNFENENGCDRRKIQLKYKSILTLHYPGPT
jgi:hypothetical protein